jgi:hypothetical protein
MEESASRTLDDAVLLRCVHLRACHDEQHRHTLTSNENVAHEHEAPCGKFRFGQRRACAVERSGIKWLRSKRSYDEAVTLLDASLPKLTEAALSHDEPIALSHC